MKNVSFHFRYTVRDVTKQRYKVIDTQRGMLGMCYILESDLSFPPNDVIGYKNVMVVRDAVGGKRLEPKVNKRETSSCDLRSSLTWILS